jgi:predicted lipase
MLTMMHASAASKILSKFGASSVTVVGHSLGGVLLLDGIYFRLNLRQNVSVRVITYGMPRVGNQDFADFVESKLRGLVMHVNNREDPIPIVPGIFLKYHHPSGETYRILASGMPAPVRFLPSCVFVWLDQ